MAGFASPGILFLNTWDSPERSFSRSVFAAMRERGYTRFVELCSGAFAMPLVAHNAGWLPGEIECSDVSLYTAIVGTMLAGRDLATLDVRVDDLPVDLPGDVPAGQAAYLLWLQLTIRMESKPDEVPYWKGIAKDLRMRQDEHVKVLRGRLEELDGKLHGIDYRPRDMFDHLAEVVDDPHTLINTNPPTYRAGFEKFFDTKGRLTWAEPDYEVFDPKTGVDRIVRETDGKAALVLCLEQREPGHSTHPKPVYARDLSPGQYVYLFSNRPEEVFEITGGPRVLPRKAQTLEPIPGRRIIPRDYEIRPDSRVELMPVKANVSDYYRNLWMHRIKRTDSGYTNYAVLVDGFVAGVLGYNHDTMVHPHSSRPADHFLDRYITLRFAFGAPHTTYRLNRLATMLALQASSIWAIATETNVLYLEASTGLLTIEYTRHPEAKSLRGIMQLRERREDKEHGYVLVYTADWVDRTNAETLGEFLTKEERWRKARTKAAG